jgi:hypothetical protein
MAGLILIGCGVALLLLAVRIGPRGARALTQGFGVLVAALGGLVLLRRSRSGEFLPGHGPRRWHQP